MHELPVGCCGRLCKLLAVGFTVRSDRADATGALGPGGCWRVCELPTEGRPSWVDGTRDECAGDGPSDCERSVVETDLGGADSIDR